MVKRVCVVTGTRAEYGLLRWTMEEIRNSPDLQLQIIATGMHLSPEFGLTAEAIEEDGFVIDCKVEMLLSSDTSVGISKSMGLGMIGFADALEALQPDLMLVLGDRFEIFASASAAMIARIPIAHLHGGEATEGAFDESIRHAITKMAHLHFTATETYRQRVIQLGEQPNSVFNVGAAGLDNVVRLNLLNEQDFEEAINFKLVKKSILVTFHPVTLENATAAQQFQCLLDVIDEHDDLHVIFTEANADTNGRIINKMIRRYVVDRPETTICFTSMGQLRYLSALQHIDGVVGNSSSGLLEAPSFKIGTINIGDRQRGRIKAESVIDCEPNRSEIRASMQRLFSEEFMNVVKEVVNPYDTGGVAERVVAVLEECRLDGILKKSFFDL